MNKNANETLQMTWVRARLCVPGREDESKGMTVQSPRQQPGKHKHGGPGRGRKGGQSMAAGRESAWSCNHKTRQKNKRVEPSDSRPIRENSLQNTITISQYYENEPGTYVFIDINHKGKLQVKSTCALF